MMERAWRCVLMVMVMVVGTVMRVPVVGALRIPSVCTPHKDSGDHRPDIPDLFRVDVECAMKEQNRSIFVREYYDYRNNRGRITQMDLSPFTNQMRIGEALYDYSHNEVIVVEDRACLVGQLSSSDDSWTFGYKPDKKGAGRYHIFGASGALHFGDTNETHVGQERVRGIVADRWDSCQYSAALNATMNVTWYFTAKTAWDMQLGADATPIRALAQGLQYKIGHPQPVPFDHTYDLYNFEKAVDPDDFEIPVGVVCPKRVNTKPFPKLPDRFSFIAEVIDYSQNAVSYIEESYDGEANINMFRYKRSEDVTLLTSMDRMMQINDYNSGASYVIDTVMDSCQVQEIGTVGIYFTQVLPNGQILMKDPAQFFSDYGSALFTYAGVRSTRDIPCDLWVGRTDKIKGFTDRNLTIEWYFAESSDRESWNTFGSQWRLPVQFRMWDKGEDDPVFELNVFYFDTVRPNLVNANIRPCFRGSQRKRLTFDIDGSARDAVYNNLEMFKSTLASTVALHTGVSQLRVADIEVYNDLDVMHVSFDLLDKPSIQGHTANLTQESSLSDALSFYQSAIKDNTFKLPITKGVTTQTITPVFGSTEKSFTIGALAGLGVGMVLLGSAGGAVSAFFFFK